MRIAARYAECRARTVQSYYAEHWVGSGERRKEPLAGLRMLQGLFPPPAGCERAWRAPSFEDSETLGPQGALGKPGPAGRPALGRKRWLEYHAVRQTRARALLMAREQDAAKEYRLSQFLQGARGLARSINIELPPLPLLRSQKHGKSRKDEWRLEGINEAAPAGRVLARTGGSRTGARSRRFLWPAGGLTAGTDRDTRTRLACLT